MSSRWIPSRSLAALVAAMLVFLALFLGTVRGVGRVGEVAVGWTPSAPPAVIVATSPRAWSDGARTPTVGHRWGPLVASQTRPIERLQLGGHSLPLAINSYTGGWADWPAWLLVVLTGRSGAASLAHALGGLGVLAALAHLLGRAAGPLAAGVAALVLATQWSFVFYRKVLGGTEIALLFAVVFVYGGLAQRDRVAWPLVILGLGLGLGAKLPFLLSAGAILAAWATVEPRHAAADTPQPPARTQRRAVIAAVVVALALLTPTLLAQLHHALAVPAAPHVRSHDFPSVQWHRVLDVLRGGSAPAREQAGNILRWALTPLAFFELAYGAPAARPGIVPGVAGWVGLTLTWLHSWRGTARAARLLRWSGVALLAQVLALGLVARDLHHLAQAIPLLAACFGLAAAHLAAVLPRRIWWLGLALAALPAAAGVHQLAVSDAVIEQIPVATFTEAGQTELVQWLRAAEVERVVVCDYEATGMLGPRAPGLEVVHIWGLASRRYTEDDVMDTFLTDVLREAQGGHLLLLRASAPMIYNLRTTDRQLLAAAAEAGLQIESVAELPARDGEAAAARLFRVR